MTAETSDKTEEAADESRRQPRILRWAVLGVVAVVVAALVGSQFMPRHPVVTRSVAVEAPPDVVFALVADLRRFSEWSPWPETDFVYTGPAEGVGQSLRWDAPIAGIGTGSLTIDAIEPETTVDIARSTSDHGLAQTGFRIEETDEGSNVTWSYTTDLGFNPVSRYFGGELDGIVGPELETGLDRLKALAETPVVPETEDE